MQCARGSFLLINAGDVIRPIRLLSDRYYLGRARSRAYIAQTLGCSDSQCISLPARPTLREVIPVATLDVEPKQVCLYAGWGNTESEDMHIKTVDVYGNYSLSARKQTLLYGFEELQLRKEPTAWMLYIPPMVDYRRAVPENLLDILESNSLWASAGWGWLHRGNADRSQLAFEQALSLSADDIDRAEILLSLARWYSRKSGAYINTAIKYQHEAAEILKQPLFACWMYPKVSETGENFQPTVRIQNISAGHPANDVSVTWRCPALSLTTMVKIERLEPTAEYSFMLPPIPPIPGLYEVLIAIAFCATSGQLEDHILIDQLLIKKSRANIHLERGAGYISVQTDNGEDVPNIQVKDDVGAILIKIHGNIQP